jgi:hypothetical protein
MTASMLALVTVAVATGSGQEPAAAPAARSQAQPAGEGIVVSEAPGLKLFYIPQPYVGGLARLLQESPRESRIARRDWPVARLEISKPFSVEGVKLPPGNYALVLVPKRAGEAMRMEFRSVPPGEFLNPRALTAPAGPVVARPAVDGQFGGQGTSGLVIDVASGARGQFVLGFRYGDWTAAITLDS